MTCAWWERDADVERDLSILIDSLHASLRYSSGAREVTCRRMKFFVLVDGSKMSLRRESAQGKQQ